MEPVTSRRELYDHLDTYTSDRRDELNRRSLKRGQGLLKAYVIEANPEPDDDAGIRPIFGAAGWELRLLEPGLFKVGGLPEGMDAWLDEIAPRYHVLYTPAPSNTADGAVRRAIRDSLELDHAWFSSNLLHLIWQQLIPQSYQPCLLRFEHSNYFDIAHQAELEPMFGDDEVEEEEQPESYRQQEDRLEVKMSVNRLRSIFEKPHALSNVLGPLPENLVRTRVPAYSESGSYEYFTDGKITNRGSDFGGFRASLQTVIGDIYNPATTLIEEMCSFYLDREGAAGNSSQWSFRGSPITFAFPDPLPRNRFENFIDMTFVHGQGPFRLLGTPLRMGGDKVHVYGLDLHLWQEIFLDLSPERFIVVLPKGTCGNTIHRLATNVQRFLSPLVNIFVGEQRYEDLMLRVLRAS